MVEYHGMVWMNMSKRVGEPYPISPSVYQLVLTHTGLQGNLQRHWIHRVSHSDCLVPSFSVFFIPYVHHLWFSKSNAPFVSMISLRAEQHLQARERSDGFHSEQSICKQQDTGSCRWTHSNKVTDVFEDTIHARR